MIRAALVISALLASIYAAHAFGLGLGNRFGHMGGAGKAGTAGPPPVSCASTGIFDLSNVCNDVYFLGALK